MAMPTTTHPAGAPRQAATPGVGMQGAAPPMAPAEAAKPVLFDDIDPVLLVRLYPSAESAADMRTQAMAAGEAAYEQGANLVAAQQEPVAGALPEQPPPGAQPYPPPQAGWRPPPIQTPR
jgi:hypothetical protein